jgi:hypothetical protein
MTFAQPKDAASLRPYVFTREKGAAFFAAPS